MTVKLSCAAWPLLLCGLVACTDSEEAAGPDGGSTFAQALCATDDGSWQGIQKVVLDGNGCTNSACHGQEGGTGGLDLRPSVAYDNLLRVDSAANLSEPVQRIYPGDQSVSFLYQKMAAATLGHELPSGAGDAMPVGLDPVSEDHLEAVRLWIRGGAPETGNVAGVNDLLACGQTGKVVANKIDAPEPPALGEGVQFYSGPWTVFAGTEDEVNYGTYYDLTKTEGLLPEWAETPCSERIGAFTDVCFAYNQRELAQDPQSHHSIIRVYAGPAGPEDPSWGEWTCLNGPHTGMACDPVQIGVSAEDGGADCGGPLTACGTRIVRGPGAAGWGPENRSEGQTSMGGAQAPTSQSNYQEGVYSVLPAKGVIVWNSHAFNLTEQDTTIEQYNNFWFAPEDERVYRANGIFETKDIFVAEVPPYEQRVYCSSYTLPQGTRLTSLSSHAHKRGILWRTWLPPNDPGCSPDSNCRPSESEPDYVSRTYNDPTSLEFDPPLEYDMADTTSRTLKYCVTYDNGKEYPELLKRNSTSIGTTCEEDAYCVGGDEPGLHCGSDDGMCGAGGVCDACMVRGGLTTEDEMFLMLGGFYVVDVGQ